MSFHHIVVQRFESAVEIIERDHSVESYQTVIKIQDFKVASMGFG